MLIDVNFTSSSSVADGVKLFPDNTSNSSELHLPTTSAYDDDGLFPPVSDLCPCDVWSNSRSYSDFNLTAICLSFADDGSGRNSGETGLQFSPPFVTCRPPSGTDLLASTANSVRTPDSSEYGGPHLWALVLLLFPALTVFGNVLVVLSVYRERNLRTATNYFIVSLAVADIMVAILVMPLAVYVEVNDSIWELGNALCDAWVAFDVMCCTASILNLTAISVDRFIAVTHPLSYARHKNSRRVFVMVGVTWIVSAAVSSPIALGANYTERREKHPDQCTFYNSDFLIYSSMASFYVPCIAMIALYWRIFRAIRRRERKSTIKATTSYTATTAAPAGATSSMLNDGVVGTQGSNQKENDGFGRSTPDDVEYQQQQHQQPQQQQAQENMNDSTVFAQLHPASNAASLMPPPPPRPAANSLWNTSPAHQLQLNSIKPRASLIPVIGTDGHCEPFQTMALDITLSERSRQGTVDNELVSCGALHANDINKRAKPLPILLLPSCESSRTCDADRVLEMLPTPYLPSTPQVSYSMHSLARLISRSSTVDDDVAAITNDGGPQMTLTGAVTIDGPWFISGSSQCCKPTDNNMVTAPRSLTRTMTEDDTTVDGVTTRTTSTVNLIRSASTVTTEAEVNVAELPTGYHQSSVSQQQIDRSNQRIRDDDGDDQQQQQQRHQQLLTLTGSNSQAPAVRMTEQLTPQGRALTPCSDSSSRQTAARRARRDKHASRREKKATKTLAIVLGVFLLCWVPFFTLNIVNAICLRYDLFDVIGVCQADFSLLPLSVWLGYINSFLNPVIYTIFNVDFRRAFDRLLRHPCS